MVRDRHMHDESNPDNTRAQTLEAFAKCWQARKIEDTLAVLVFQAFVGRVLGVIAIWEFAIYSEPTIVVLLGFKVRFERREQ